MMFNNLSKMEKADSFVAHFEQHFKSTTSRTDLSKCKSFKLVKKFNNIASMKPFKNLIEIYTWINV